MRIAVKKILRADTLQKKFFKTPGQRAKNFVGKFRQISYIRSFPLDFQSERARKRVGKARRMKGKNMSHKDIEYMGSTEFHETMESIISEMTFGAVTLDDEINLRKAVRKADEVFANILGAIEVNDFYNEMALGMMKTRKEEPTAENLAHLEACFAPTPEAKKDRVEHEISKVCCLEFTIFHSHWHGLQVALARQCEQITKYIPVARKYAASFVEALEADVPAEDVFA